MSEDIDADRDDEDDIEDGFKERGIGGMYSQSIWPIVLNFSYAVGHSQPLKVLFATRHCPRAGLTNWSP